MADDVGLPLTHEERVEGVAASVFRDVRARIPFVPALFKALAHDPEALLAAWLQARALYDDPATAAPTARLRRLADPGLALDPTAELRTALRPFVEELPFMLLIVASLSLTLDGRLPRREPPDPALPSPGPVPPPELPDRGEHPLFPEICRVYGTQHLPSVFRMLAARGLLDEAWQSVGPFLGSVEGTAFVDGLGAAAEHEAARFAACGFFSVERARPVVEQFRRALPRNLVLAVSLGGEWSLGGRR
jgi:hypothetical protein